MRAVRELLGHANVETMRVYTHGLNRDGQGVPVGPDVRPARE
jgi:hypothetical protein